MRNRERERGKRWLNLENFREKVRERETKSGLKKLVRDGEVSNRDEVEVGEKKMPINGRSQPQSSSRK